MNIAEATLNKHLDTWSKQDKQAWLDNWADNAVLLDPVGAPEKQGKEALEKSWDLCFNGEDHWRLEPIFMQACADQVAVHVKSHGFVQGQNICIESIELY